MAAILFAGYLVWRIMKNSQGTPDMVEIARAVQEGAWAYLKRQYSIVALFFAVMFIILFIKAAV
jgi:K(+)-stimulated pyrophosphate-energized sodium pump